MTQGRGAIGFNAGWRTDGPGREGHSAMRYVVNRSLSTRFDLSTHAKGNGMNTIIYIVGLVVVIGFILSFFGLR